MDNPTIGSVNNSYGNELQLFISSIMSRCFRISDILYNVITDLKSSSSINVSISIFMKSSFAFKKSWLVIARYLHLNKSYAGIWLKNEFSALFKKTFYYSSFVNDEKAINALNLKI